MILKHKNMKDVAAWILNPEEIIRGEPSRVKVRWLNVTGKKPFMCPSGIETITIDNIGDWKELEGVINNDRYE